MPPVDIESSATQNPQGQAPQGQGSEPIPQRPALAVPDAAKFMRKLPQRVQLSARGEDYVTDVVNRANAKLDSDAQPLTKHIIEVDDTCVVVVRDRTTQRAAVMLMQETVPAHRTIPRFTDRGFSEQLVHTLETIEDLRSWTTHVVVPAMYDRPDQQATHLACELSPFATEASTVTLGSITSPGRGNLLVSTNVEQVRSAIAASSPDDIPPRVDYGCVVYMKTDDTNRHDRQFGQMPNSGYEMLLAVGGFTDLIAAATSSSPVMPGGVPAPTHIPLARISAIHSKIPQLGLYAAALGIITEFIIKQRMWQQTFSLADRDFKLMFSGPDGSEPVPSTSEQEMLSYLNTYCAPPQIALDVTDGRSRAFQLDTIAMPPHVSPFHSAVSVFFTDGLVNPATGTLDATGKLPIFCAGDFSPVLQRITQYSGIAKLRDRVLPIEDVDYFRLVKSGIAAGEVQGLHTKTFDPAWTSTIVGRYASVELRWTTHTYVLNPTWLTWVHAALRAHQGEAVSIEQIGAQNTMAPMTFTPNIDWSTLGSMQIPTFNGYSANPNFGMF